MQTHIRIRLAAAIVFAFCAAAAIPALAADVNPAGPKAADDGLYRDLGGTDTINKIAVEVVDIALTDERIKDTFADTNIDRLKTRLGQQLCVLAGGPCVYKGKGMVRSHKPLKITVGQFNALAEDLQVAMDHAGVSYRTQNRLIAILAPMQRDIVTR